MADNHIDSMVLALRPGVLLARHDGIRDLMPEPLRSWRYIVPPEPDAGAFPVHDDYEDLVLTSPCIDLNVLSATNARGVHRPGQAPGDRGPRRGARTPPAQGVVRGWVPLLHPHTAPAASRTTCRDPPGRAAAGTGRHLMVTASSIHPRAIDAVPLEWQAFCTPSAAGGGAVCDLGAVRGRAGQTAVRCPRPACLGHRAGQVQQPAGSARRSRSSSTSPGRPRLARSSLSATPCRSGSPPSSRGCAVGRL